MQILLLAATVQELNLPLSAGANTDVMITGVGVPSTLYHLQKRLQQFDYDMVIQAGIAGTNSEEVIPGQCVLVKQDVFADLGTEENEKFSTVFDAGLSNPSEFPFDNGWLVNPNPALDLSGLSKVKGITVNKVSDSQLQKKQFAAQYAPQTESMEGAALHYICLLENVPFIQLRAISNEVGVRNKAKWKIQEAIRNLNNELATLLDIIQVNPPGH
jgi:futalosine hydrolase